MNDLFIVLIIGIGAVILFSFITRNRRVLKKLRAEWETKQFIYINEDFDSIASYWKNKKNNTNYYGVDDVTWNDLSMDEVFKRINYTKTSVGTEYLFNQLRDIDFSRDLEKDEKLYNLLETDHDLRESLLLLLVRLGKLNHLNTSSFFYGSRPNRLKYSFLYSILAIMPLVSVGVIFIQPTTGVLMLLASFAVNVLLYYRGKSKLEDETFATAYLASLVETGKKITGLKNEHIQTHIDGLSEELAPLKKLTKYSKLNFLGKGGAGEFDSILEYVRIIFLLDFISYNKIMMTITAHQRELKKVWECIGKLDAAIAVVFYRRTLDHYCTPSFIQEENVNFENLAHPLLENPVVNSSSLNKLTLITGSNASGKSTYIKAIAINAILAQTINTATASKWTMKPSYIISSMAVQDNIFNDESYFIAEIKSLKRILNTIEKDEPVISFIDEILKGTNTIERIAASASIMKWLSSQKGMNILATHDIELTEIAEAFYTNKHFREIVKDGIVSFDYKVHDGPSTTRNAIKLLDVLDFPKDIVISAEGLAKSFNEGRKWSLIEDVLIENFN